MTLLAPGATLIDAVTFLTPMVLSYLLALGLLRARRAL